ncbi:MAG: acyltransferase [Bacteroidales bacterium]|nr:acyltransferase [Bacteroidales bacterium]
MKFLAKLILRIAGWHVSITAPDYPKCIICVAPHTSNWDFILGKLAYLSVGRDAGFLMKESWFFPPLGYILKGMGGIPVSRKKNASLVDIIISKFNSTDNLCIAITPEGTRKKVSEWRTGLLHIAYNAKVPILLGKFDFKNKSIYVDKQLEYTNDIKTDMMRIKDFYKDASACYPDKFSI